MSVEHSIENAQEHSRLDRRLLEPNTLFHERYHVIRCLGVGGMGAVYEVTHLATQRRRALKTLLPELIANSEMRERFKLEMTITAEIESEHIVEVFDAGFDVETGLPFLVMEFLRGESLAAILRQRGSLSALELVTLLHQASLALERTHAAGIVHRDLKPENLFVTRRDDGSPRLKVLDFGIAKVMTQSTFANTTRSFGTPLYMSPEQVRGDGDIDGRADVYALGQIAFTALVGHAFWEPETENAQGPYAVLLKVAAGAEERGSLRAARFGSTLPEGFDAWFDRATHPAAPERYESAVELVEELARTFGISVPRVARCDRLFVAVAGEAGEGTVQPVATLVGVCESGKTNPEALTSARRNVPWRARRMGAALLVLTVVGTTVGMALWNSGSPDRSLGAGQSAPSSPTLGRTTLTQQSSEPVRVASDPSEANPSAKPSASNEAPRLPIPIAPGTVERNGAQASQDRPTTRAATRSGSGRGAAKRVQPAPSSGRLPYDPSDLR